MKAWFRRHLETVICAPLAALLVAVVFAYELETKAALDNAVFLLLSDGCFVAGVLFTGTGLLTVIAQAGGFDGLGYAFYSLRARFNHSATNWKADKSFEEYRKERREKPRRFRGGLTVGIVCLILAALFDALFSLA